jgi:hypothetical protein
MSYKSAWFGKASLRRIANDFNVKVSLLQGIGTERFAGAYGSTLQNRLRQHTDRSFADIDKYLSIFHNRIKIQKFSDAWEGGENEFECGVCGWQGKGTGYRGALREGDRCPNCGVHL